MSWLENAWYNKGRLNYLLAPLSLLFWGISTLRVALFKLGIKNQHRANIPVIVVGNISVGGTGKTPFVIYLVELLRELGLNPAIVSRGYGALADDNQPFPRLVQADSNVQLSGDEPKLLAMSTGCPVVIDPNRSAAVRYVETQTDCDIVISDDGLQHYAMSRDLEIVLLDKSRMFGNGWLLPVGPLRELPSRLQQVDITITNSGFAESHNGIEEYCLSAVPALPVFRGEQPLPKDKTVHLVSGIGNPQRFLDTATGLGYHVQSNKWLPDHHKFTLLDFAEFGDNDVVVMTEKDAVKCRELLNECDEQQRNRIINNWYVLPIKAQISKLVEQQLVELIEPLKNKYNFQNNR
ncbi:MAG: tetraacyldisaccharide 4'-kinase [Gammaproteobacteria bacterium]|nr:tetraacyldisaccharide 4'-kinase [Gammaproteobacteria bacterium]